MGSLACDLNTIHGRLKAARMATKFSQEQVSVKVGLTKSGISQMEQGKRPVSKRHLRMMALMLGINEQWVLTGEGEMLLDREHQLQCNLQEIWGLSTAEAALVTNFVSSSAEQRKSVFESLEMIKHWCTVPSTSI